MDEKLITIYTKAIILNEVAKLAKTISNDYIGKDLVLICILKGAKSFHKDLSRHITIPHKKTFMSVSSYGNHKKSPGTIRLKQDTNHFLKDKHILIIEDIVDTGQTLNFLYEHLAKKGAKSIEACTLLQRIKNKETHLNIKYTGFKVGNGFYVGYGLDYAEKYRELPNISIVIFEEHLKTPSS